MRSYYSPRTLEVMERGFRSIRGAFLELRRDGKVGTTDLRRLTEANIVAFLEWMRGRKTRLGIGLAYGTQANYIDYLNGFLRFENNGIIDPMRKLRFVRFPKNMPPEVRVMSESRVEELRSILRNMPGYHGAIARFMVAMYAYSGLRRSELRLAFVWTPSVDDEPNPLESSLQVIRVVLRFEHEVQIPSGVFLSSESHGSPTDEVRRDLPPAPAAGFP